MVAWKQQEHHRFRRIYPPIRGVLSKHMLLRPPLHRSRRTQKQRIAAICRKRRRWWKSGFACGYGTFLKSREESREDKPLLNKRTHQKLDAANVDDKGNIDAFALVALLKAYADEKELPKGSEIHSLVLREGFLVDNVFIGSALISMYAKCGEVQKAQNVFDEISCHNVVSWTSLIAAYVQHGHAEEAFECYEKMQSAKISPNAITAICILKACGSRNALDKGQEIHDEIVKDHLLEKNIKVANALVDMYVKCSALENARKVFDELEGRNIVTWNALIAGYTQQGYGEEALACFEWMQKEGFYPNEVTYVCLLRACGSLRMLEKGKQLHDQIVREELIGKNIVVANALIDMYGRCGMVDKAQAVFDKLEVRDVVSWNALIGAYSQSRLGEEALTCYKKMHDEGLLTDAITFVSILTACGGIGARDKGLQVHAQIVGENLTENNIMVANALIDFYAKCGALERSMQLFDELPIRNVVSWNSIIAGCVQHGRGGEALSYSEWMQVEGFPPNAVTFACMLKACGITKALDKGLCVHVQIVKNGLQDRDVVIGNALVDMYATCGSLTRAKKSFGELLVPDIVSFNVLLLGYLRHNFELAWNLYEQMLNEGVSPDEASFVCILRGCGDQGATHKGQTAHGDILRHGSFERDFVVGTGLVDMYAKLGMLAEAQKVFDGLPVRSVVSWSALMEGYTHLGKDEIVFGMLDNMIREGNEPDLVTLTIVLNLCSHGGLVKRGQLYFETGSKQSHMVPTIENYTSMIDLLGRAGHFDEAVAIIKEMPMRPNLTVWHTLLATCKEQGNMKLGRWAFEQASDLDGQDAGAYVCLRNIYACGGRQKDIETWRGMGEASDNIRPSSLALNLCTYTD